jgi:GTPase SAR1 family protein
MRITKVRLRDFKRFDDLTIDLGPTPKKIVALVGPNGCGKSSVFDAFEEKQRDYKGSSVNYAASFFSKLFFTVTGAAEPAGYDKHQAITLETEGNQALGKKSFYIRSSYRFTPKLNVKNIRTLPDVIDDQARPSSSIEIDSRLQENYERLLGRGWHEYQHGTKSGPEMREELIGRINTILNSVIDVEIIDLGDVISGKGQLYFRKGKATNFPYENLSSGEKEVVDLIIDLVVKVPEFNDTVFCIDEPELHLNTSIQRKLLVEINKLIPESCQLWVATHSIGFLRALQEDIKDDCSVFDFSEGDFFDTAATIKPILTTRKNWNRIFETALEDLTGLLAPNTIIYCEGRPEPDDGGNEQGLDANVYNTIFEETHHSAHFVSSGGVGAVNKNSALALKILAKSFTDVQLLLLTDRDDLDDEQRNAEIKTNPTHKILIRRAIENYLFEKEVLSAFCVSREQQLNSDAYDVLVTDINNMKLKPIQQQIKDLCPNTATLSVPDFKLELANFITPDTAAYKELESLIFNT